ncbi:WD repeat-containing protein 25-like [Centruroides vittatus]|uniref:WD repeat-containing protein 25-like n=1 Tax=Centruroides vittatus TaxID=120091 RepID=UPI00350FCBF4
MDILKEYLSSDDSNEEFKAQNERCDYFQLNEDDDDEEEDVKREEEKIRAELRIQEETRVLHSSNYGPNPEDEEEEDADDRSINKFNKKSRTCSERNSKAKFPKLSNKSRDNEFSQIETKSVVNNLSDSSFFYTPFNVPAISEKLPSYMTNKINAHSQCISKLNWSPSFPHLLLSSSFDCTVKVWNLLSAKCEREFNNHAKGIKAGVWTLCGRKIFSGGYDCKANHVDVVTGKVLNTYFHSSYVTCVRAHPENVNVLLTGSKNSIKIFDVRTDSKRCIKKTSFNFGQVLDLAFLSSGKEIICSSDLVSKDSADRTIMAWDFETGALLSNQIYQERYTCPSLKVHPSGVNFIAQTNGNYIAVFSSTRPYKMNKNKRYEGHKVCGYNIDCDFSPDGNFILSGDVEGSTYIYKTDNAKLVKRLICTNDSPVVSVCWHPKLMNTLAIGTWNGQLQFWK